MAISVPATKIEDSTDRSALTYVLYLYIYIYATNAKESKLT